MPIRFFLCVAKGGEYNACPHQEVGTGGLGRDSSVWPRIGVTRQKCYQRWLNMMRINIENRLYHFPPAWATSCIKITHRSIPEGSRPNVPRPIRQEHPWRQRKIPGRIPAARRGRRAFRRRRHHRR